MSIRRPAGDPSLAEPVPIEPSAPSSRRWRLPACPLARYRGVLLMGAGGLLVLLALGLYGVRTSPPRRITQQDIDAAVLHTLTTKPLPSRAAKAYEVIRPSVVRVRGWG